MPLFITSKTKFKLLLKRGGKGRTKKNGLGKTKIALAGGAGALALVIAVIASSGDSQIFQNQADPSNSAAGTSGMIEDTPPADSGNDALPTSSIVPSPTTNSSDNRLVDPSNPIPVQVHFTDDNFMLLRSDPEGFANSSASITGKVYEVIDQSSGGYILITFRINNQAIESDESRAAVMFQDVKRVGSLPPSVEVDDCISIEGKVRGAIRETNSFGQTIKIPIIDTSSMQEIECIDSALPALKTLQANLSQTYGGITLVMERIQFADGHLRLKIVAQNVAGGDSVFIREKESLVEYGGNSYRSLSHLPIFGTYKIDSAIPAESETEGYIFFEPVVESAGGQFVFRIVVEKVGISESEKSTFILKV